MVKDALIFEANADTGEFNLYLPNVSLDDSSQELRSILTVKADDVVGKRSVLFKNIKKRK